MTQRSSGGRKGAAGGFTITELLVVMIVITVVISILIPSIGLVRDAARGTSTQGLMNNIVAAASKFSVDHKRQPGYFSAREMGSALNEGRGMSTAENVMLDLAGGVTGPATGGLPPGQITVGPTPASEVYVDPAQIGAKGAYFVPPQKFYVAQTHDSAASCQQYTDNPAPGLGHTGPDGVLSLPDLVDAWGHPLLIWVEDDTAVAPVNPAPPGGGPAVFLAKQNSGNTPARFYWASNAAFLKATALGKKGKDQTFNGPDIAHSMIGDGPTSAGHDKVRSLESALGNPNFPWKDPANPPVPVKEFPASARAPFIVQSAGRDAYYFGRNDRGGKTFADSAGSPLPIEYTFTRWATFPPLVNMPNLDKNGNRTNVDVTQGFDDLMMTSAN